LTLLAVLALSGCTDETIVYKEREPFNPPPDQASGFLGYYSVASKTTTCGNCHVGHQRDWRETAHAGAFETLDTNSHKQATCYSCHTVNELGNAHDGPSGWNATPDSAYRDVQCESCHGPGYAHVQEPEVEVNVPLARASLTDADASCASCHSGTHHPYVEEWAAGGHGIIIEHAAGRAECQSCHEGKAALEALGSRAVYHEKDDAEPMAITCTVCHDPHGNGIEGQLRFAITERDPERNLCMRCHIRRTEPTPGSSRGTEPHAPQGAVLLGTAGYRPAGFDYDTSLIESSHGTEQNPGLCATCHVNRFTVTDELTGAFVMQATGHLFFPIPCVDGQGRPTANQDCEYTETARSFNSCASAGCHPSVESARSSFNAARTRLKEDLADVLWDDVNGNQLLDAGDTGYLTMVPAAEFAADNIITAAEGALFNVRLVAPNMSAAGDKSQGTHNPFLAEALLRANIEEMQNVYGLPAPPARTQAILRGPLGAVTKRTVKRLTTR
jgi:predicted CXXCH cytochrome family protein